MLTLTEPNVVGGTSADIGSPLKTARWFEPCLDSLVEPTTVTGTAQTTTAPEKTVVAITLHTHCSLPTFI